MSAIWKRTWRSAYLDVDRCLNVARREAGLPVVEPNLKVTIAIKGFELTDDQFSLLSKATLGT